MAHWKLKVPQDMWSHPMVSATPRKGYSRRLQSGGYGQDEGEESHFTTDDLFDLPTIKEQQELALKRLKR